MEIVVSNYAWFRKTDLTEDQIKFLKQQLTIYPKQFRPDETQEPPKLELFTETATSLGVARAYFESRKKPHHNIIYDLCDGDPTVFKKYPVKFNGTLRPQQVPIVEEVLQKLENGALGGLMSCPTGFGKTTLSCNIIGLLEKPTLVMVNKEFLMDQWVKEIGKFLPQARVGKVQQDECSYKDKHIVLGMMQTLVNRDYPPDFYNHFGMIITDEGDMTAADTFSQLMPRFKARIRLLVSATFRRGDGAENAFYYQAGGLLAKAELLPLIPKIRRVWTDFHLVKTSKFNPALISEEVIMRFLCGNTSRNEQIIEQVILALQAGRKILVVSHRIKHLKVLKAMFDNTWKKRYPKIETPINNFCIGGVKENEIMEAAKGKIIWGSNQYVSRGFNIPPLDTLILTTPASDVVQIVGRVTRISEGKKEPVVVDFRDDMVSLCKSKAANRDAIYEQLCGPAKPVAAVAPPVSNRPAFSLMSQ